MQHQQRKVVPPDGEKPPPYPNAAHHIVAGNDPRAEEARDILDSFDIGINDAENGVFLPYTELGDAAYHPSLHTDVYYDTTTQMLQKATSQEKAIDILRNIKSMLQSNTFPY